MAERSDQAAPASNYLSTFEHAMAQAAQNADAQQQQGYVVSMAALTQSLAIMFGIDGLAIAHPGLRSKTETGQ